MTDSRQPVIYVAHFAHQTHKEENCVHNVYSNYHHTLPLFSTHWHSSHCYQKEESASCLQTLIGQTPLAKLLRAATICHFHHVFANRFVSSVTPPLCLCSHHLSIRNGMPECIDYRGAHIATLLGSIRMSM